MDSKTRTAVAEALVDGWHSNDQMWRIVKAGWGRCENHANQYELAQKELGVRIWKDDRVQTWLPRHMRRTNEALWDGRNRETCVAIAVKELGGSPVRTGNYKVHVRKRDKSSDWKTVK